MVEVVGLPSGKNRVVVHRGDERRLKIGAGEQAEIFRILTGPRTGLVCRSPVERPGLHFGNSEKEALLRFRRHQIAHNLFPDYNLDVVGVDLETREIYSVEVVRSKQNLRDCTHVGLLRRFERSQSPIPLIAEKRIAEMKDAGVVVQDTLPNVSVVSSNGTLVPTFFEVCVVDCAKTRSWIEQNVQDQRSAQHTLDLLDAITLESQLRDVELFIMLRDRNERIDVLNMKGLGRLEGFYDREIGTQLILKEF